MRIPSLYSHYLISLVYTYHIVLLPLCFYYVVVVVMVGCFAPETDGNLLYYIITPSSHG